MSYKHFFFLSTNSPTNNKDVFLFKSIIEMTYYCLIYIRVSVIYYINFSLFSCYYHLNSMRICHFLQTLFFLNLFLHSNNKIIFPSDLNAFQKNF